MSDTAVDAGAVWAAAHAASHTQRESEVDAARAVHDGAVAVLDAAFAAAVLKADAEHRLRLKKVDPEWEASQ